MFTLAFSRDVEAAAVGWIGVVIGFVLCLLLLLVISLGRRQTKKQRLEREFKNGYRRIGRAVDMLTFEARTSSKNLREILTIARGLLGTEYSGGVSVQLEAIVRKYKPVFERRQRDCLESLKSLRHLSELSTSEWLTAVQEASLDLRGIDKAIMVFAEIEKLYIDHNAAESFVLHGKIADTKAS